MERRTVLLGFIAMLGMTAEGCAFKTYRAPVRQRRGVGHRARRRVRRRVRRRIRRRVAFRVITGRNVAVVPVGVAVGWELAMPSRVVVVREVRPKTIIVVDASGDGAQEEIEIVREDTPENTAEEQGTELAADDTTTPSREAEEDQEVEEEVEG